MENSSVLDNSNNGSSFKEKKPKRKLNRSEERRVGKECM